MTTRQYKPVNALELRNITQTYGEGADKKTVFDNFTLEIKDIIKGTQDTGQFFAILGESGCGKSTLLRFISGLQKPTSGEVLLYGKPRTEADRIPMVFQQYSSSPWYTVLDNIALPLRIKGIPKKQAREQAMEMVKIVGLEGHENKYAKTPALSGGQLQRVAIARNLVANPEILLMDEPFGALDTMTRRSMQMFLRHLFEKTQLNPTVVLVTHEIREAVFMSTDIIVLSSNPACIRTHLEVDLPDERTFSLKRTQGFQDQVNFIEDVFEKLEAEKRKTV